VKNTKNKRKMEGEIKEIIGKLGIEVKVEEIRKLREGHEEKGGVILVKIGDEFEKEEMMKNKEKLKGTKIWIQEDRSWEERKAQRNIREIARRKREKGRKVWISEKKLI